MRFRLALAALLVGALGVRASAQTEWKEFRSKEGAFAVLAPVTPVYRKQTSTTPGGTFDIHFFAATAAPYTYAVSYLDFPQAQIEESGAAAVLEANRDSFAAGVRGKLAGDEKISLERHPGRAFRVERPGEAPAAGKEYRVRQYLVGNRLYQVIAVSPRAAGSSPDLSRFLDSFKLLKK